MKGTRVYVLAFDFDILASNSGFWNKLENLKTFGGKGLKSSHQVVFPARKTATSNQYKRNGKYNATNPDTFGIFFVGFGTGC